jgi:anaerobic dimethyl sulfoxide reductase subunit B (iron-sulfur subunit)
MQIGFYFDQTRCTGCGTCRVACKDWHNIPAGSENWIRVLYTEKGKFPDVFVSYTVVPCYHCLDPVCIPSCPAHAISKRDEDGIVVVDSEACLGNEECNVKCLTACPYDVPQFGPDAGRFDELKAKYGHIEEAIGSVHSKKTKPAIVSKPKHPRG